MILPPAQLGMLGGGQLARFFVIAAHEMGYRVMVLDPDPYSPAGKLADHFLCAGYEDEAALREIVKHCAAVTTEFENVPAQTLQHLAQYLPVHPDSRAVAICQHRIQEKAFLTGQGFPVAPYMAVHGEADLAGADAGLFPGILKVARFGYDGKGQVRVTTPQQAIEALRQIGSEACVLEQQLALDYELSVVLARGQAGEIKAYPAAHNRHRRGILDLSIAPAPKTDALAGEAQHMACAIAEALCYVGTLGVEFLVSDGRLFVNEIAPRPHNSGHYTLDAADTDQFEQQVRALCGVPLGSARLHSIAVMVNLLGDVWPQGQDPDWATLLTEPDLKLHLYGKTEARPGRKMGHFTLLGHNLDETLAQALRARAAIGITD